jgi:sulfatase maturation enzyme AslB (radical SAM superfamily)
MLLGIAVALTTGCNLRCGYCYQRRGEVRSMPWEVLRCVCDRLVRGGAAEPELGFGGGEPLLALPMMVRAARYLDETSPPGVFPRFAVTTNGTLIGDDALRFLALRRVRTFLSFDGVDEAQRLRGQGTFALLDALLDRLHTDYPGYLGDHVTVTMTLSVENLPYLAAAVRYFLRRGVPSFTVSPVDTPEPGWHEECLGLLDRELAEASALCRAHFRQTGSVPFLCFQRGVRRTSQRRRGLRMCRIGEGHGFFVDVDGEVVACGAFAPSLTRVPTELARQAAAAAHLGHIADPDLLGRFESCRRAIAALDLFRNRERKHSPYGDCGKCRHLTECRICPMAIAALPGNEDPHRIPPLPCAFNLLTAKYRRRFPQ